MNFKLCMLALLCLVTYAESVPCPPNDGSVYPVSKCSCIKGDLVCRNISSWSRFASPVQLHTLTISDSHHLVIHNNTFEFLTVDRLTLSNNHMRDSALNKNAFGGLTVSDLDLSNNFLSKIPLAVRFIPGLKGLNVSVNGIPDFRDPEQIETMKKLGNTLLRFSFGSHDILRWPPQLKYFPRLEELSCTTGDFPLMSVDAFHGYEKSLKKLHLSNTLLWSVPLAFGRLTYLTELSFDHNHFVGDFGMNVPLVESLLTHLTKISLNDDNITTFPHILSKFRNLLEVVMNDNTLKFVSEDSAKDITHIKSLSLRNSGITRIPGTLQYIKSMISIDISDNHIHTIERQDLQELTHLVELKLNNNPIIYLSDKAFTNSGHIGLVELRNTNLTKIPCGLDRLRLDLHPVTVDFTGSKVECTCALRWLYNWRHRSVSNHPLTILGDCVTIPSSLQDYLENNLVHCPADDHICNT